MTDKSETTILCRKCGAEGTHHCSMPGCPLPPLKDTEAQSSTTGPNLTDLERKAIAIAGVDNWYPWIFRAAKGGVICTGAVCPLRTKGPRKGDPNYRKHDPSTKFDVIVPAEVVTND